MAMERRHHHHVRSFSSEDWRRTDASFNISRSTAPTSLPNSPGSDRSSRDSSERPSRVSYERLPRGSYERPSPGSYEWPARGSYERPSPGSYDRPSRDSDERPSRGSYERPRPASYERTPQGSYERISPSKYSMGSYGRTSPEYCSAIGSYERTFWEKYVASSASIPSVVESEAMPEEWNDYVDHEAAYRSGAGGPDVMIPSSQDFADLFPSLDRLTIHHDDRDVNANLRVDTTALMSDGTTQTFQLFHLRMFHVLKREFSFRRRGRDSRREICNSKRIYVDPESQVRPHLQRSVTSAVKILTRPQLLRPGTAGSIFSSAAKRPGTSHSKGAGGDAHAEPSDSSPEQDPAAAAAEPSPTPTNAIKLEFTTYARFDLRRLGSGSAKRYGFSYWGHDYAWRRATDKLTAVVSFHLLRDDDTAPLAHIVPEARTLKEVHADETEGRWVPPCHMWFSDVEIRNVPQHVSEALVATGIVALVDDCIKQRWESGAQGIGAPVNGDISSSGPKAFVRHIFSR